jgi:DNA-binding IclR family transcriptional regulator
MEAVKVARPKKEGSSSPNVQVINRMLDILETLADEKEGLRLTELAAKVDLPSSTVHRLLNLMVRRGYVEQDEDTHRHSLGLKIVELYGKLQGRLQLPQRAAPLMQKLAQCTGELVQVAVLSKGEMLYILTQDGTRIPRLHTPVGSRSPVHCTSLGKAVLAQLEESDVRSIIEEKGLKKFTPRTIDSMDRLLAELKQIREKGYAIDYGEQYEELTCVGAPIFDSQNRVVAGISVTIPMSRLQLQNLDGLAETVAETARGISASLGHQPPRDGREGA